MISYSYQGCLQLAGGIQESDLERLRPQLDAARQEVLSDLANFHAGAKVPAEKQPLDSGFHDLPERLLRDYRSSPESSELRKILAAARGLAEEVDRVVVLGIGGSYMGARALFEACCHPYHNELSRAERGGWPRMYFEGNNVDNDGLQGLLGLLGKGKPAQTLEQRWGIVVISKSGGTLETAAAFRIFYRALLASRGSDAAAAARAILPVTGETGKLRELTKSLGCESAAFPIPDGVGGRFSILCAVGLLPAALLGLDVVKLLEGAAAMNDHFRVAPAKENVVLNYVGVCHLMESLHGASIRVLSTWGKRLEAAGLWYDQLLSESLGKAEKGATPITGVNTRDLHSRGQQHQEGKRDKLITNVYPGKPKEDAIAIGTSQHDQDALNALASKTLPDVLQAAFQGTNQAYRSANRPTADIVLPQIDEYHLGQYFQMMMLATVLEGRLIGINPYGQPGVEDYKRNMNAILKGQ